MGCQGLSFLTALAREDYSEDTLSEALTARGEAQQRLFAMARQQRLACFPRNDAQVRSVIEVSNVCRQKCRYCAIGGKDQALNYTLSADIMFRLISHLVENGRKTVLLQSGENVNDTFISDVTEAVARAKARYPFLRIILCLGNLQREQYSDLHDAGASDYILKFETSNASLFSYCKPNDTLANRLSCIETLHDVGFNIGSGNIVGLPRQTLSDLVQDLLLAHELPLAMNSTTIFIPAENSEFANEPSGDANLTLNMMALLRIMNPHRYMPTTSSLEKMIPDGQYLGLMAGANTVTVHDGTPPELEKHFPIYSSKRIRPQTDHFRDILARAGMTTDNAL
ncbi:MAG: radical SAM protein [Bacteroidaceae bacterium]|nr:radical SAM protein [Bacteroidaceae bacterium]